MWPRIAELTLGLWLWIGPFVFRGTRSLEEFVVVDRLAGSAVIILSLLCWWQRASRAHLLTLVVAGVLALRAYTGWERPGPPAAQNDILVSMLWLLFAIIPSRSSRPPQGWTEARV